MTPNMYSRLLVWCHKLDEQLGPGPPSSDALNAPTCDVVVCATPAPKTSQQLHEEAVK